ncbi:hypothetical protein ACO0RG_001634 [Hanseniaspora osmophila]|uniref:H(+)/Cl(-) exchange transporter 3 n=1 Tax=Hanseniaspora osmophila TaxID=56408 RepID=A0A1E5RHS4_9ASCO|nr:H(+)/Cl(-) exchange transporter 3 [Hanseniaspora osmophila]
MESTKHNSQNERTPTDQQKFATSLQQKLRRVPLQTQKSQTLLRESLPGIDQLVEEPNAYSQTPSPRNNSNTQNITNKPLHLPSKELVDFASQTSLRTPIKKFSLPGNVSDSSSKDQNDSRVTKSISNSIDNLTADNLANNLKSEERSTTVRPRKSRAEFYLSTPNAEITDPLLSSTYHPNRYGATNSASSDKSSSELQPEVPTKTRNFYDDFTSVDWVKDYIYDANSKATPTGNFFRLMLHRLTDWFALVIICLVWACIAYVIDKFEELLIDFKKGVCFFNLLLNEQQCLKSNHEWVLWPQVIYEKLYRFDQSFFPTVDFLFYVTLSILLAYFSVKLTLTTKNINPLTTQHSNDLSKTESNFDMATKKEAKVMYSAYGSGVPEVKTVLSGFTIRKFLGSYTLFAKGLALVFAIASGLSLGKEGPYVHLATCCGNICSRFFTKYKENGIERRILLSASAAAGVALAFGSPLGGVLFALEEVSYYLPGNQLFKTFFAAIVSTLFLTFLNPYGTGKAVLFSVNYESDWVPLELPLFTLIGVGGGVFGALFCKFVQFWGGWFRSKKFVKNKPIREVLIIALLTAFLSFANPFTNTSVASVLASVASPCYSMDDSTGDFGLCPLKSMNFMSEFNSMLYALVVKIGLTAITFGLKVPAGIYVPSMIIGALGGRLFGMFIQYVAYSHRGVFPFNEICSKNTTCDGLCVDMGIYAMIGAASTMAGVTRMNVTLAVIMFELTSSYNHVLPMSIAIACSNFVANFLEPRSLYENLIIKNDLPYLNKQKPYCISKDHQQDLKYIMTSLNENKKTGFYIDVSKSNYVPSNELRCLLEKQQRRGLVDGCIPILKNDKLVGILPGPELELALDKVSDFRLEYKLPNDVQLKLFNDNSDSITPDSLRNEDINEIVQSLSGTNTQDSHMAEELLLVFMLNKISDLTDIVETAPIILSINSPLSLVELVFINMGNRYIVIMNEDQFVGFLHKKDFIDYCRRLET